MPVCSYLVIPQRGARDRLAERLSALPGCDVVPARNRDLLLLVTDTADPREDRVLRERIEGLDDVRALVLSFGEVDPVTDEADPLRERSGKGGRGLPVVDPGADPGHVVVRPGGTSSPPNEPSDLP
jgi:nitrate reductase NapAB chaperone NapD